MLISKPYNNSLLPPCLGVHVPVCQCGLYAVVWLHIGIFMRNCRNSQCLCGTILPTLYFMVCGWRASREGPMILYWPKLLAPFLSSVFPFSSFCCEAGVYGLMGCKSLSPGRAFPTFFNNNNNNKNLALPYSGQH